MDRQLGITRYTACTLYPPIYLSIHPSICLSVYLSIYQSIHPSVYLSIYLSICLSACAVERASLATLRLRLPLRCIRSPSTRSR